MGSRSRRDLTRSKLRTPLPLGGSRVLVTPGATPQPPNPLERQGTPIMANNHATDAMIRRLERELEERNSAAQAIIANARTATAT
jgi:hypothetical protein